MTAFNRVSVIGAGAWGTALAGVAARAGREVTLYARDAATAATIATTRENPRLPGVRVDRKIEITSDMSVAGRADVIVIAVPAQSSRVALAARAPHLAKGTPVVSSA
jgi:glycerol-3-phosphate dehydrogenase (NAD(P)+)